MSFTQAELTANIAGLGVLRLLESVRMVGGNQNTRSGSTRRHRPRCLAKFAKRPRPN